MTPGDAPPGPGSLAPQAALSVVSSSPEATEAAGRALASSLEVGDLVGLDGELGAGKTVLVRGLVAGLGGAPTAVRSPTFVLHQVHAGGSITLHHIDLYRLDDGADIAFLDLPALLESGAVVIEWASRADLSDVDPISITIEVDDGDRRIIRLGPEAPDRLARVWTLG